MYKYTTSSLYCCGVKCQLLMSKLGRNVFSVSCQLQGKKSHIIFAIAIALLQIGNNLIARERFDHFAHIGTSLEQTPFCIAQVDVLSFRQKKRII